MDARRIASFVAAVSLTALIAASVARSAGPPDLTGTWRLDEQRSDAPRRAEGGGGGGGHHGGGAWGGDGGGRGMHHGNRGGGGSNGGGGGGEGGPPAGARRTAPLPDVIHITETATVVSFEDTTGAVLQEITTLNGAPDKQAHAPGAPVIAGAWNDQALEISHQGGRGTMTQTYTLEDGGRTLVVKSAFTGGDGEQREFKRVYDRIAERSTE